MTALAAQFQAEDGTAATQLAVLMPAVLLLIMLTVQVALWAHGQHLAAAAADIAAITAATPDATPADGENAARAVLASAGNLDRVEVTVEANSVRGRSTIRAVAPQLVPGLRFGIDAHADAPRERFVPQAER